MEQDGISHLMKMDIKKAVKGKHKARVMNFFEAVIVESESEEIFLSNGLDPSGILVSPKDYLSIVEGLSMFEELDIAPAIGKDLLPGYVRILDHTFAGRYGR